MLRLFLASCLVLAAYADIPFVWKDCSSSSSQVIFISSVTATPGVINAPGQLHLSFTAKVSQRIDVALIKFDFTKIALLSQSIHIPCVNGFGSCTFDACSLLSDISASSEQGRNVSQQITSMFSNVGASISCPIPAQNIAVSNFVFAVPALTAAQGLIADGDYTIKVEIIQPGTQAQLGCLQFNTSIKRKAEPSHHFLFN